MMMSKKAHMLYTVHKCSKELLLHTSEIVVLERKYIIKLPVYRYNVSGQEVFALLPILYYFLHLSYIDVHVFVI
jgi:hypothetical protein